MQPMNILPGMLALFCAISSGVGVGFGTESLWLGGATFTALMGLFIVIDDNR